MLTSSSDKDALVRTPMEPVVLVQCPPLLHTLTGVQGTPGKTPEIVHSICSRDPRDPGMARKRGPSDAAGPMGSGSRPLLLAHMPEGREVWVARPDSGVALVKMTVPPPRIPWCWRPVPAMMGPFVPEGLQ